MICSLHIELFAQVQVSLNKTQSHAVSLGLNLTLKWQEATIGANFSDAIYSRKSKICNKIRQIQSKSPSAQKSRDVKGFIFFKTILSIVKLFSENKDCNEFAIKTFSNSENTRQLSNKTFKKCAFNLFSTKMIKSSVNTTSILTV